ncbi:MAG: hypothetical protein IJY09_05435 [Lachnospiraceae bacterium]|nr:hypothetical protein [Lachnospiraceae bacterium]
MKKENFVALVLGTVSGLVFALGMCMCLLPEWNLFNVGVGFGIVGAIGLLATAIVYRKMSGKKPVKVNAKVVGKVLYGVFASLVLGTGMSMIMVLEGMMLWGILVGIVGIVLLLCLVPMCIGLKK